MQCDTRSNTLLSFMDDLGRASHDDPSNGMLSHPMVRALLVFSAFRAVYGMGILVVTYTLATSENSPWWLSLIFLGVFHGVFTMVVPQAQATMAKPV